MKNKNIPLYCIQTVSYTCMHLIAVGTIFQTFLLECGIDEAKVSFCVSAFQVLQTVLMLLISKVAEKIQKVSKWIAVSYYSYLLMLFAMLLLLAKQDFSADTKYIIVFATGIVQSIFIAIVSILTYKQPHHIMDMKHYGSVEGQCGVISGVLGILLTFGMTMALRVFPYSDTMTVVCLFGVMLSLTAGSIGFLYKPVKNKAQTENAQKINIFKYKPFWQLLAPNFLRGFSTGIFNLIPVVGYHCNILDSSTATLLAAASQAASLLSNQTFVFISEKHRNGLLCLISSIGLLAALPTMLLGGTKTVFVICYFIAYWFMAYINVAIPVVVAERIEYNCLGQYTAWRMALYTLGISVGGVLVPTLLNAVNGFGTLLIGGISMLPCGIGYFLFEKNAFRTNPALPESENQK